MSQDVVAIPLGEDGGEWFVEDPEGLLTEYQVRSAILKLIRDEYDNGDDMADQVEELALASRNYDSGWWATGHGEGHWVNDEEPPRKVSGWFVR